MICIVAPFFSELIERTIVVQNRTWSKRTDGAKKGNPIERATKLRFFFFVKFQFGYFFSFSKNTVLGMQCLKSQKQGFLPTFLSARSVVFAQGLYFSPLNLGGWKARKIVHEKNMDNFFSLFSLFLKHAATFAPH